MAKRQRFVYDTNQVIHLWAHQTQSEARNKQGNVSFQGKNLFSYSTIIGQLETDINGQVWAFLSSESLTPTTSKHVNSSRRATQHMERFFTPAFAYRWSRYARTPKELIQARIDALLADFEKLSRLRNRLGCCLPAYESGVMNVKAACRCFGIEAPDMPELSAELLNKVKRYEEQRKEKERRREEERLVRQKQEQQQFDAWLASDGQEGFCPASFCWTEAARAIIDREARKSAQERFDNWLLRGQGSCPGEFRVYGQEQLTIQGDEVLTSLGARAPLAHVAKALRFYDSRLIDDGSQDRESYTDDQDRENYTTRPTEYTPYQTNGHKIPLGYFVLDSIDEQGNVKAGCHRFTAAEIARFREQWEGRLCHVG